MTEVTISAGALRGVSENGLHVFKGIPFAVAGRFAAPQPAPKWGGVRDATQYGPACPQGAGRPVPQAQQGVFGGLFGQGELPMSEDCLNLNVWTPGLTGKRPVMVWIHGGAFALGTGASPMYSGASLAKRGDVVVVTINYRLGPFGFTYLPGVATPNAGLLDQAAALRWVQAEIAAFGGDPENVTIFGESAGGKSVECLLALPAARGLFTRAVLQSTYDAPMVPAATKERAEQIAAELGGVEKLKTVSADDLLAAASAVSMRQMAASGGMMSGGGGTAPVVDGEVLPKLPIVAIRDGDVKDVSIVVGTTVDEARLFGAMMPQTAQMDDAALLQRLVTLIPRDVERAADVYRVTLGKRRDTVAPSDVFMAASTDRMFRQHSIRVAEAQSKHRDDTFMYLFAWEAAAMDGRLGACHGLEIPFVFGTLDGPLGQLAGGGPDAQALSERMQDAWLSFARTGDVGWPAYDASARKTMVFGRESSVEEAPLEDERAFWASIS